MKAVLVPYLIEGWQTRRVTRLDGFNQPRPKLLMSLDKAMVFAGLAKYNNVHNTLSNWSILTAVYIKFYFHCSWLIHIWYYAHTRAHSADTMYISLLSFQTSAGKSLKLVRISSPTPRLSSLKSALRAYVNSRLEHTYVVAVPLTLHHLLPQHVSSALLYPNLLSFSLSSSLRKSCLFLPCLRDPFLGNPYFASTYTTLSVHPFVTHISHFPFFSFSPFSFSFSFSFSLSFSYINLSIMFCAFALIYFLTFLFSFSVLSSSNLLCRYHFFFLIISCHIILYFLWIHIFPFLFDFLIKYLSSSYIFQLIIYWFFTSVYFFLFLYPYFLILDILDILIFRFLINKTFIIDNNFAIRFIFSDLKNF